MHIYSCSILTSITISSINKMSQSTLLSITLTLILGIVHGQNEIQLNTIHSFPSYHQEIRLTPNQGNTFNIVITGGSLRISLETAGTLGTRVSYFSMTLNSGQSAPFGMGFGNESLYYLQIFPTYF